MQTSFTTEQLAQSAMQSSEKILRSCVHCGFCTATCPTYVLLGDELDSPRGRIYQIKDMFENNRAADKVIVKHVDRCLSCLSCMTTCPSGVNYMHLIDHARAHIEETYQRPLYERLLRGLLIRVLPYPNRMRLALFLARFAKPFKGLFEKRMAAMLALAPAQMPTRSANERETVFTPTLPKKGRVALLQGCAQPVLKPSINDATISLLLRHGIEIVTPPHAGCCGALVHHMGQEKTSHTQAKKLIDLWCEEADKGLDAILITASGCGTTIKDYGHMFRDDAAYAAKAKRVSALAKDITQYLVTLDLKPVHSQNLIQNLTVAYHSACSMQHGQQIKDEPKRLLKAMGLEVKDVPEGHLCCGSAGTYNILQPEISAQLRTRKIENINKTKPDIIATGNIGCITQLRYGLDEAGQKTPIVHTVELLNWLTGGKKPEELENF
jgi:glycolate oxidase iron-sulfur subunit